MTRATEACARLEQTREALRLALGELAKPAAPVLQRPSTGWMGALWRRLKTTPGTRTVVQGVTNWAEHSPLSGVAAFAFAAVNAALRPIAQRGPLRLVLVAMAIGGVLTWSRPWRRIVTPAMVAAVLPQLVLNAVGGMPRLSWMAFLSALVDRQPVRPLP